MGFIFHQDFITEQDKKDYLLFLRNLLKDRPYVLLAYITGILPIAKYSSGSELNMFMEYTMISEEKFSDALDSQTRKQMNYTNGMKKIQSTKCES